jgi:hypothetical protein
MQGLPPAESVANGQRFTWNNVEYEVSCLTRAHYRGVEGELPFEYWDKTEVLFADLGSRGMAFGTLDYSDPAPLLFLGDALGLKNLRQFEGW